MTKVVVPQIGQSIAEATIVKWFKKPGDRIEKGEILVEIGTDKINTEIPAPEAGILEKLLAQEGETVPVLSEIAEISAAGGTAGVSVRAEAEAVEKLPVGRASVPADSQGVAKNKLAGRDARPTNSNFSIASAGVRHSPVVRRLAQEHNIDLSRITGTGEGGRITKEDVQRVIDSAGFGAKESASTIVPMSRMRKLIAEHMVTSKRSTAELTTFFEIDMTEVGKQREKARDRYDQEHGLKLTYLPFIIAAVAKALRAFPILNSSMEGENIRYKQDCNIGIATAVDDGLIVPVVKKADEKNILALTRAVADLAERARNSRLTPDDMSDGTFTITNPGVFGALLGTPIINFPQVAILGVGAIEKRPVVIQDAIVIRTMSYFSLTYDHRAMDGAAADSFMAHLKKTLEISCPPALE